MVLLVKKLIFIAAFYSFFVVFAVWKVVLNLISACKGITRAKLRRDPGEQKRLVIIGGGFAGTQVAQELENDLRVTLIDNKDYFEFTPSILRTIVEPAHMRRVQVMHCHYLHKATLVHKQAVGITPTHVVVKSFDTLETEEKIPYDFLVVSTGSFYSTPFKESSMKIEPDPQLTLSSSPVIEKQNLNGDGAFSSIPSDPVVNIPAGPKPPSKSNVIISTRANTLRDNAVRMSSKSTRTVLIIGGGIVGVELAAEIVEHYPKKEVILIHSGPSLMPRMPKKTSDYSEWFLSSNGVKIMFNERVNELVHHHHHQTGEYTHSIAKTNKGNEVKCDMAFLCTGIVPNSTLFKDHFSSSLSQSGFVKTNRYLQLDSCWNIFVCGDVVDIQEEKLAQNAEVQATIVAKNILSIVLSGSSSASSGLAECCSAYSTYSVTDRPILVSLGQYCGVLVYGKWSWCGFIPAILKEAVEWKTMVRYR